MISRFASGQRAMLLNVRIRRNQRIRPTCRSARLEPNCPIASTSRDLTRFQVRWPESRGVVVEFTNRCANRAVGANSVDRARRSCRCWARNYEPHQRTQRPTILRGDAQGPRRPVRSGDKAQSGRPNHEKCLLLVWLLSVKSYRSPCESETEWRNIDSSLRGVESGYTSVPGSGFPQSFTLGGARVTVTGKVDRTVTVDPDSTPTEVIAFDASMTRRY